MKRLVADPKVEAEVYWEVEGRVREDEEPWRCILGSIE